MKISFTNQSNQFEKYLHFFITQKVISYHKIALKEKITTIEINSTKVLAELDLSFLWNYHIFPKSIMAFLTEWNYKKRQMQIGDTILQQAFFPPLGWLSQKLLFGVRINNIINEPNKKVLATKP
jgi:hypothetical protein